jgi:asparagine synthase (glutamine-hydrolysing)
MKEIIFFTSLFISCFITTMCGIRASLTAGQHPKEEYDCFQQIQKRGPDITTRKTTQHFSLGFHRLGIMDPRECGDQPFIFQKGSHDIFVLCNGEIYNYPQLKEKYQADLKTGSDCEVIGLMYQEMNVQTLAKQLDGEFAVIIIDHDTATGQIMLSAFRDPYGVRPLFRTKDKYGFRFCSEMKGLMGLGSEKQVFKPGTIMTLSFDEEKITQHEERFYTIGSRPIIQTTEQQALHFIQTSFYQAIEKRLMADRPLGCLLSGGLDSSLVCAVASDLL